MVDWGFPFLLLLPLLLAIVPIIGYGRTQRLQAFVRDPRLTALGWFFLLYGASVIVQSGGAVVHFSIAADPAMGAFEPGEVVMGNGTDMEGANGTVNGTSMRDDASGFGAVPGPGVRIVRINGTGEAGQFNFIRAEPLLWPFWLRHALVLAALAIVAVAYLRPNGAQPPEALPPPAPPLALAFPALLPLAVLAAEGARSVSHHSEVPFVVLANAVLQTAEACLALAPSVLAFANWLRRRSKGSLQVAVGFGLLAAAHIAFLLTVFTQPPVLVPLFDLLALAGITTLVFAVPRGP